MCQSWHTMKFWMTCHCLFTPWKYGLLLCGFYRLLRLHKNGMCFHMVSGHFENRTRGPCCCVAFRLSKIMWECNMLPDNFQKCEDCMIVECAFAQSADRSKVVWEHTLFSHDFWRLWRLCDSTDHSHEASLIFENHARVGIAFVKFLGATEAVKEHSVKPLPEQRPHVALSSFG